MGKLSIQGTLFDTLWQVFVFLKVVLSFMEHRKIFKLKSTLLTVND